MEGIIGSDDDEEDDGEKEVDEGGHKGKKMNQNNVVDDELSPSQAILLSEKQTLMKDALKQNSQVQQESGLDDIDDVLGDLSHVDGTHVVGKQLEDKEEKISNSSTPVINEQLEREARKSKKVKNKIELNVEMTEEMKRQEQSLNFGATPYSSKSISITNTNPPPPHAAVQNASLAAAPGIGTGLNSVQRQREFILFKKQGQQGVQNSPEKEESVEDSRHQVSENGHAGAADDAGGADQLSDDRNLLDMIEQEEEQDPKKRGASQSRKPT